MSSPSSGNTSSQISKGHVFCFKLQKQLPAMQRQPFGGEQGKWILANISRQAWSEWMVEQTKLINELHLNPLDPHARAYLQAQALHFLHGRAIEPYDASMSYSSDLDTQ